MSCVLKLNAMITIFIYTISFILSFIEVITIKIYLSILSKIIDFHRNILPQFMNVLELEFLPSK